MSLEAALIDHAAALKENTEQLKLANEGRTAAIEAAKNLTAEKPRAGRTPSTAKKDDAKAEPKADAKPPAIPTAEEVKAAGAEFLSKGAPEGQALEDRKTFVKAIIAHLGCPPVQCAEEDRAKVIGWFKAKTADMNAVVNFSDDEGGEEPAEQEEDNLLG